MSHPCSASSKPGQPHGQMNSQQAQRHWKGISPEMGNTKRKTWIETLGWLRSNGCTAFRGGSTPHGVRFAAALTSTLVVDPRGMPLIVVQDN